jgi:hypothetical protein
VEGGLHLRNAGFELEGIRGEPVIKVLPCACNGANNADMELVSNQKGSYYSPDPKRSGYASLCRSMFKNTKKPPENRSVFCKSEKLLAE